MKGNQAAQNKQKRNGSSGNDTIVSTPKSTCRAGKPPSTASGTSPRLFSRSTSLVKLAGSAPSAPAPVRRFPPAETSVREDSALRSGMA